MIKIPKEKSRYTKVKNPNRTEDVALKFLGKFQVFCTTTVIKLLFASLDDQKIIVVANVWYKFENVGEIKANRQKQQTI